MHLDASKEVRTLLEFLFLDVKVRSPAEIAELTDEKLFAERANLLQVSTAQLIKDIRSSIEVLLSIKNDPNTTENGGHMETLMMNDDSVNDKASFSDHPFKSFLHHETNPFEKASKIKELNREGPVRGGGLDIASSKSQSLFSNPGHGSGRAQDERARTEQGSRLEHRRSSMASEVSMTTQENCKAMEQQLQKYEGDIRKHISIEHQLQLFAEDLKRSVSQLEKEKESLEALKEKQLEELRKDKVILREFLDMKEKTIGENAAKI